jgi:glycosyltransferase involved in cell wall biosynthesis
MDSNSTCKISVLMPAYNAEKYIGEAIESILNQTFTDFEFIIIDDCSTDRTWEIIQGYAKKDNRLVILKNEVNSKICKTLNRGILIARGKYIARMDADDWSYRDRLAKQFVFMESNQKVGVSGGSMEVCDAKMKVLGVRKYNLTDQDIRKKLFFYSPFSHPLIILKTEAVKKAGYYNEDLFDAEDYDLYFRIGRYYKFGNLKDVLLKYRTGESQVSFKNARRQEILTLYTRIKAMNEYGYKMNRRDKTYLLLQFLSMFLIPQSFKIKLFNLLRNLR